MSRIGGSVENPVSELINDAISWLRIEFIAVNQFDFDRKVCQLPDSLVCTLGCVKHSNSVQQVPLYSDELLVFRQVQIRNSVVMPYCESFLLDWMVADKDNWRPQDEFPFPFFVSQASEVERKTSKQNFESTRSPSRDETWRYIHRSVSRSQSIRNRQNKPPKAHASYSNLKSAMSSGSSKPQKPASGAHHEQATPLQPSALGLEHHQEPRRSASSELYSQIATPTSPRPASVPHLKYLLSDPAQLQASVILAVGSASISRGSKPLLTDEERPRGETLGSITDSELGASSMGMPDAKSKDCASHSEESSSESDMQPLRIKVSLRLHSSKESIRY